MYQALQVFCEHWNFKSTYLLIMNKEALDYFKPRMDSSSVTIENLKFCESLGFKLRVPKKSSYPILALSFPICWDEIERWPVTQIAFQFDQFTQRLRQVITLVALAKGAIQLCKKIQLPITDEMIKCGRYHFSQHFKFPEESLFWLDKNYRFRNSLEFSILANDSRFFDDTNYVLQELRNYIEFMLCRDAYQIAAWACDNGYRWKDNILEKAVAFRAFRVAEKLLESIAWKSDSMSAVVRRMDVLASSTGDELEWMVQHGCPWDLSFFYENPAAYLDWKASFERVGMKFDRESLFSLLQRSKSNPKLLVPAKAIIEFALADDSADKLIDEPTLLALLPYCRNNLLFGTVMKVLQYRPDLECPDLACVGLHLPNAQFRKLLEQYPSDGKLWQVAAIERNHGKLELLKSIHHTWKTQSKFDWSSLCEYIDWRWLHDAGSPCRRRH